MLASCEVRFTRMGGDSRPQASEGRFFYQAPLPSSRHTHTSTNQLPATFDKSMRLHAPRLLFVEDGKRIYLDLG